MLKIAIVMVVMLAAPAFADETIVIHDPRPKVEPKPVKHYSRIAPPYSDYAIEHDKWARAWLLLDIDASGNVQRVKFLKHPGFELDDIAIRQGLAMKFEPARNAHGDAVSRYVLWTIEWPSYWWLVMREGVTTGIPDSVNNQPCAGSGPWHVKSFHPVYRDCSGPDFAHAASEPWHSEATGR
jgi:hypothetical protein